MLFILMVSSVGLPIISHKCTHDNVKDVHLFSSVNHKCKDTCGAPPIAANKESAFQKTPCCSFDTSLFISDVLITAKNEIKTKDFFVFIKFRSFVKNALNRAFQPKTHYTNHHQKAHGFNYRIALQSFLY